MQQPTFEQFWNLYGIKRDKIAAERAWKRLAAKDRRAAVDGIKSYRQDCTDHNRMMMYPQGYLNHRRWEDDFSESDEKDKSDAETAETCSLPFTLSLPVGCRMANRQEVQALQDFRKSVLCKEPAKPMMWTRFTKLVEALTITYVEEKTGIICMAVTVNGKPERITEYMIEYYDSYADFYKLLTLHFDIKKLTFNIIN